MAKQAFRAARGKPAKRPALASAGLSIRSVQRFAHCSKPPFAFEVTCSSVACQSSAARISQHIPHRSRTQAASHTPAVVLSAQSVVIRYNPKSVGATWFRRGLQSSAGHTEGGLPRKYNLKNLTANQCACHAPCVLLALEHLVPGVGRQKL